VVALALDLELAKRHQLSLHGPILSLDVELAPARSGDVTARDGGDASLAAQAASGI
jgi:hypothetical protein